MLSSDIHVFQFIRFTLHHNSNPTVGLEIIPSSIAYNTISYVVCLMIVIDEYTQKGHHARSHVNTIQIVRNITIVTLLLYVFVDQVHAGATI